MHLSIPAGTTSKIVAFPVFDSSSTTGRMLTGLVYNSASLTAYYNRTGASGTATNMALTTMTKGAWEPLGFVAVDEVNMPGWYELGVPDAAFASGCQQLQIMLKGATNMVPVCIEIELTVFSNQVAAKGGGTMFTATLPGVTGTVTVVAINIYNGDTTMVYITQDGKLMSKVGESIQELASNVVT